MLGLSDGAPRGRCLVCASSLPPGTHVLPIVDFEALDGTRAGSRPIAFHSHSSPRAVNK
jgi:hypothetical protein